jgi:hypothetical protein
MEVAGFVAGSDFVFVCSSLAERENLRAAERIAGPVRAYLSTLRTAA